MLLVESADLGDYLEHFGIFLSQLERRGGSFEVLKLFERDIKGHRKVLKVTSPRDNVILLPPGELRFRQSDLLSKIFLGPALSAPNVSDFFAQGHASIVQTLSAFGDL